MAPIVVYLTRGCCRHLGDALVKIFRSHGLAGLYRGLPIQAIGIIPEKALKLSVNDAARFYLRNRSDNSITLFNESLAGATAGLCQVVVTSPMEMLKIHLQMQATLPPAQQKSAVGVIMDVVRGGLPAAYRGASATLLRDVFFSALYFPAFSNLKLFVAQQDDRSLWRFALKQQNDNVSPNVNNRLNLLGTFGCGLVAGSVTGWAATPLDVIKTRLQSTGGKEKWVNIPTCVRLTLQKEGMGAFFKGATARVLLIGPLFGIVLATYEFMPAIMPL